jgi:site-specific DNA-methyltransferase (adenine-specific)
MNNLILGDNIEVMKNIPDNSFDSVVTDPPYGINFMNRGWDNIDNDFHFNWAKEVLRIVKPGANMLVFGSTRTFHRLAVAIEDAGWEIKDCLMWLYGEGFPKSMNMSKAIDSFFGKEGSYEIETQGLLEEGIRKYIPATEEAKMWQGWGSALKPAWEPIFLLKKPISEKNNAANTLKYNTGPLNIEDCRIPVNNEVKGGRWPPNLILDDDPEIIDRLPVNKSKSSLRRGQMSKKERITFHFGPVNSKGIQDEGSVARFFYCSKAYKNEREYGLDNFELSIVDDGRTKKIDNPYLRGDTKKKNIHPTVKPVKLLRYLVRLITPPNGTVLDPFMGSGSTGIACVLENKSFYGIEIQEDYFQIAKARIEHVL